MRIGLIAEGRSDLAVLTNIIRGVLQLDRSDIIPLRPRTSFDNTHLAHLDPDSHSSWTLVKQECIDKTKIGGFLAQEGNDFIIIHLDTAEAYEYDISKPLTEDIDYSRKLRTLIVEKIKEWTEGTFEGKLIHAIAIEEIDAWILTLHHENDSSSILDPKKELQKVLTKGGIKYSPGYENYMAYSDTFRYPGQVRRKKCLEKNYSLKAFWDELESKQGKSK